MYIGVASFKQSKSLISSQHFPRIRVSVTKVQVSSFDLACANLVLLLSVRLAVVLISINQSSNCVESLPPKDYWYFQKWFAFVLYIRFLYIAVIPHQGDLVGLNSKMLGTICGVHIPSDLWLPWAYLCPFQLYDVNYQILWSGLSG